MAGEGASSQRGGAGGDGAAGENEDGGIEGTDFGRVARCGGKATSIFFPIRLKILDRIA